jgi:L-fuculose-phosphate aldolase
MNKYELLREFQIFGRDLFLAGINNSHSGNISYCSKPAGVITITRSGAMLGHIGINDLVETGLAANAISDKTASRELVVHRAIYEAGPGRAIIHSHPPSAIALSLKTDLIRPIDAEGSYYFPGGIKVIDARTAVASPEVGAKIAPVLKNEKIAVVRGHGAFAVGASLEECFLYTTVLESVCKAIINYAIIADADL